MLFIEKDTTAEKKLIRQLKALNFDRPFRFKVQRVLAGEVKKRSAKRVTEQKSLAGGGFKPRSTRRAGYKLDKETDTWRKKRKLLVTLGKAKYLATYRGKKKTADEDDTIVSWSKKLSAKGTGKKNKDKTFSVRSWAGIAWGHHHGMTTRHTARDNKKQIAKWHAKMRNQKATLRQAKALIRKGYKKPVKVKGGKIGLKRVSAKEICETMSSMQASWILRLLVKGDVSKDSPKAKGKQSWIIKVPARPFLGATEKDAGDLLNKLSQMVLNRVKKA